jgi:hypothetical protein
MIERIKNIALQSNGQDVKFAQLVAKDCADHIMESSDRYRKEYFADKILTRYGINDKHDWIIKKVPNTKDEFYVESGTPPKHVLAVYGIEL